MDNLLTEVEMMETLKVSRSILYQLRKDGMPFVRIGRMVRYNPNEIETWLATMRQGNVDANLNFTGDKENEKYKR